MSELLSLLAVAWIVYISDAAWWVGHGTLVLTGRAPGAFRVRAGPQYAVRQDSGFLFTGTIPPFSSSFELTAPGEGEKAALEHIRQTAAVAMTAAAPLRWLGASLWGFTFVIAPASIVLVGLYRAWLPVVAGLFGSALVIVVVFARAWRAVHPASPRGWTSDAVPMLLAPLGAIRAADKLTRRALQRFNGIAVAGALATDEEFIRLARLWYFERGEREQPEIERDIRAEVDRLLAARALTDAFHAPPPPEFPGVEGYCPRCRTQLMRAGGWCPDCVTVPIQPL